MSGTEPEDTRGRRTRRPTRADVARLAGVSAPVVSAVVNPNNRNNVGVGAATRERVLAAVRELGYVPNLVARSLAGGRSNVISLFTYEAVFPAESENFFHEFFVGIEQEADAQGYSLLLVTSSRDASGARAIYVDGRNSLQLADGAIIFGGHHATDELSLLHRDRFPFVHIGRRHIDQGEISYVAADYVAGARAATDQLIALGHRRIAFASTELPADAARERKAGFLASMESAGLDPVVIPLRKVDLLARIRELGLTAVVLETVRDSRTLHRAATEAGLAIPVDLSLVSLGGQTGDRAGIPISGLTIPRREMGRLAVRHLIQVLDDPTGPPVQSIVEHTEEYEATVAPPRS